MRISDWSSDVCSSDLGRLAGRHMLCQKRQQLLFSLGFGKRRGLDLVNEPALAVGRLIPFIHRVEQCIALVYNQSRTLGHEAEISLDRQSLVSGQRVRGRVELWRGRILTKKKNNKQTNTT